MSFIPTSSPSSSTCTAGVGTISSRKRPEARAFAAFAWDAIARVSCVSRDTPYFSATFSDVMPIGVSRFEAFSSSRSKIFSLKVCDDCPIPFDDIDSTPAPIPTSIIPDCSSPAILSTACSPDEHCRFTVLTDTSAGKPARNCAPRALTAKFSANTFPTQTSSTCSGLTPAASTTPLSTVLRSSSAGVLANAPRRARPIGVRSADTMTISSSASTVATTGRCVR
mmetsp:Transcript_28106/g.73693  ORF Transcript_28106/g.73693 Transcript_28106/m.73693 type:complete len:224 (-) Transcript_28106:44-715(-)